VFFSLTTIQPEQCFSASFSQNSVSRMGPASCFFQLFIPTSLIYI